jgi:hypothetical protein
LEQTVEKGEPAPPFNRVTLGDAAGRPLVLIFHLQARRRRRARSTAPSAPATRPRKRSSSRASWTSPSFLRLPADLVLSSAYEPAAGELPADADPADYVVILPDWGGLVRSEYGARRTGRAAAIVVVDEDFGVTGSYQGERPVEAVLELLESVFDDSGAR